MLNLVKLQIRRISYGNNLFLICYYDRNIGILNHLIAQVGEFFDINLNIIANESSDKLVKERELIFFKGITGFIPSIVLEFPFDTKYSVIVKSIRDSGIPIRIGYGEGDNKALEDLEAEIFVEQMKGIITNADTTIK